MRDVSTGASRNVHLARRYSLRVLPADSGWDERIRPFSTRTVFHSSSWLAMLEETTGGQSVRLEVNDGDQPVGYFCGLIVRKGPFRLLGSPLPLSGTPAMGPISDPGRLDQPALLHSLSEYCRGEGIDLLEICCPWLDDASLRACGFRAAQDVTFAMDLAGAQQAWRSLNKTTRNCVRQAERSGVRVEPAQDEQAIHEHFRQLGEVLAKYRSRPSYPVERPLAMWRHLYPSQLMLLQAMHEGRSIATYLLVHDHSTMWGLASASRQDSLRLRPNDLLHWKAIETACGLGLSRFDFCGGGDYKEKYGGVMVPRVRWTRFYSPLAALAYRAAESVWRLRQEIVLAWGKR